MERANIEDLRAVGLFGGLSDEVLEFFSSSTTPVVHGAGSEVFRENEPATAIFVVLAGRLELTRKDRRGTEVRLALVHPRDWVGEVGLIDMKPRSSTVRALEDSLLLPIPSSLLNALYRRDLKSYTLFVLNIAREMCRRLRAVDEILVECVAAGGQITLPGDNPPEG
ncbi:MAG: cyclic nucleotide-binding domain-containing protein [Myxococcales bacterium]|nr:cyclic nucleotide-binding domain-containing protein [Polyangiaceae bacterium]MDW8251932.1 cyclic nucleotide-binding domain-containing protein [Myxococcales bacterium]